MATIDEVLPEQAAQDFSSTVHDASGSSKRKASVDAGAEPNDYKRTRHEDDVEATRSSRPRDSYDDRPRDYDDDRRKSATQEEKKRGKRLFGGLLNTLSQKTANPLQKRRQEIERKQQERLQKQRAEDEDKRVQHLSQLRSIRMAEQIGFEEDVMKHRQSKRLDMARYLRTRSRPHLYYLPWKLTAEQQDEVDAQVRKAQDAIEKENADFASKRQEHEQHYGPSKRSRDLQMHRKDHQDAEPAIQSPAKAVSEPKESPRPAMRDQHDESGDVLVEAGEDMVIY